MSYAELTLVIETKNKGVIAHYEEIEQDRYLWPKVLGQTNTKNRVLCVELEPYTDDDGNDRYRQKHWRCFSADDLDCGELFVVPQEDRPEKWRVRHLRHQSCVDDVEFFR